MRGIAALDGKLLCVRLKPYPGALMGEYDFWCIPGGGVDEGEALEDAFRREMIEELGIKPKIGRLLYVQQFARKQKDILEFFFLIENPEDYLRIDLTKTTHGTKEIEAFGFIDPSTVHILPDFLGTEPLAEFITSNQPPKFFVRY